MLGDILSIHFKPEGRIVHFQTKDSPHQRAALLLREGFGEADVHEALRATGWVEVIDADYRLTANIRFDSLVNTVDEMFDSFVAAGIPNQDLLIVQLAVTKFQETNALRVELPLFALAWLDVIVRDDIADEGRRAATIWSADSLSLDCRQHRERRVAEVLARYTHSNELTMRMARSVPTRSEDRLPEAKSG